MTALPCRAGIGFKHAHWPAIAAEWPDIGFFEVHAENYMGAGGPPRRMLAALAERYPVSLHGVGLSIGGEERPDRDHLARLRALIDWLRPARFSEHLAWSTHEGIYFNDLLPLPYDAATLERVARHVDEVQEALGLAILIENPSRYLDLPGSTMEETDFLAELARRTGCGLLLDINNVHVSACNLGYSAAGYLDRFPLGQVGEIHLAGHAVQLDAEGSRVLIDAHDRPVDAAVWELYRRTVRRSGPLPTLIEWDNDLPGLDVLLAEAAAVESILAQLPRAARAGSEAAHA